jgi:formylglycine-generating enzyme required for sulfatase activity
MHGNVWEFCLDEPRTYTADTVIDPRGPNTPDASRVLRGGSYGTNGAFCRAAMRKVRQDGQQTYRTPQSGFRVVCEAAN